MLIVSGFKFVIYIIFPRKNSGCICDRTEKKIIKCFNIHYLKQILLSKYDFFCNLQKKKTHLVILLAGSGSTIELKKAILTGSITDKRFYT